MDTEAHTFAYTRIPHSLPNPHKTRSHNIYMQKPVALKKCPDTILWGKEPLKMPLCLFCVDHLLLGVGPTLNSEFLQSDSLGGS